MIRLCYFGRIAPEKGIDVLLRAMEMVKIPVELDVYGIGAKGDRGEGIGPLRPAPAHPIQSLRDDGEIRLRGGIGDSTGGEKPQCGNPEARIRWLEPVKPEEVVETIRNYDALVVPSVWLETGPLVVLEAFAAGVPVIGSRLGGIAEMVQDGVDGLLFEAGSSKDLADKIQEFHRRMKSIKAGVPRVKNTREVGYEHLKFYQKLLSI